MLSFAHMLLSAMQSAISLKVAQTGLASIQNPVHTLVMQLYPLCNAQLLTQEIAYRYFLWHRCLGHSQIWPWLRFVVCYLLGAVFVVLCQLWQPSGHSSSHLLLWVERACSSREPALPACARVPLSHPGSC